MSCQQEETRLRDLEKISSFFPTEKLNAAVSGYLSKGVSKDDNVKNPLYGENTNIFISNMNETRVSLETHIRTAIESKVAKNHTEKEITILIIDNRTSAYDMEEYSNACESLREYLKNIPFPKSGFIQAIFLTMMVTILSFRSALLRFKNNKQICLKS